MECVQHYASPPQVSKELSRRQQGQSHELRTISWRAQHRLHRRYTRLLARRLQRNKAIVAVARELCGFIWERCAPNLAIKRNPDRSEKIVRGEQPLTNKEVTRLKAEDTLTN